jgi:hypothetical protein
VATLPIRIRGRNLPGLQCLGYSGIHVGVQRGKEVVNRVPGDAPEALFDLSAEVVEHEDGPDFRGPYVHGPRGDRFLYLSWGEVNAAGGFAMFRRAKLRLGLIDRDDLRRALESGAPIEAHLPLKDGLGNPICASLKPPILSWRVASIS